MSPVNQSSDPQGPDRQSPNRESIEAAIRRVQLGELSPAEATEWLLASQTVALPSAGDAETDSGELLSQLVDRLGMPPADIADTWSEQVKSFTAVALLAGEPLPSIEPDQWQVGSDGSIRFRGSAAPAVHMDSLQTEHTKTVNERAKTFRAQFATVEIATDETEQAFSEQAFSEQSVAFSPSMVSDVAKEDDAADQNEQRVKAKRGLSPSTRKAIVAVMLALSVAAIGWILFSASQKQPVQIAEETRSRPVDDGITHHQGQGSPNTSPITTDSSPESLELATFESTTSSDDTSTIDLSAELLSLDSLMPAMPMLATEADPKSTTQNANATGEAPSDTPKSDAADSGEPPAPSDEPMLAKGTGDDPLADEGDEGQPEESPQATHQATNQATSTSITLPATDDTQSIVTVHDLLVASPSLNFPMDVAIDLRQADPDRTDPADSSWNLVDSHKNTNIATIFAAEGRTQFQWAEAAKRSSVANLLCHGALIDHGALRSSGKQLIYLRPKIVSEPYRIALDEPDSRPSWDLASPLPPRVARLALDFDLPKATKERNGIELGWIEPVDATSPRRTRALAVLTPTDGETIAVGVRFDIRCSRKLTSRIRVYGRLDPKTPWQLISQPMLNRMADQVTDQATRLSEMSTRMSVVYSNANSYGRRELRPQRDAIEMQSERIVAISQRLAELQSLVDQIESDVQVRFRLWVQWGENKQDLLVMTDPVAEENKK